MQLGKISKGTAAAAVVAPAKAAAEPAAAEEPGRALVPVAPAVNAVELVVSHRDAQFLAQLIATKNQHPQTRGRRRAEPAEAIAAYRATASLVA